MSGLTIAANHVVSFHYTLKNAAGEVLDASGDEAMTYLHGHENIVPGLERAMAGHAVGDAFQVEVAPGDAYGEKSKRADQKLPRSTFGGVAPQVGEQFAMRDPRGRPQPLWVTAVDDKFVHVTFDHPLAGVTLLFEVAIAAIRAATAEEVAHGHPHGPDGHHHH